MTKDQPSRSWRRVFYLKSQFPKDGRAAVMSTWYHLKRGLSGKPQLSHSSFCEAQGWYGLLKLQKQSRNAAVGQKQIQIKVIVQRRMGKRGFACGEIGEQS